jgi:hypothetical protein
MTTSTNKKQSIQYSNTALKRAERALSCSPFQLALLSTMRTKSVTLSAIACSSGYQQGYTKKILGERATESELMWLLQVGLLRREVDGQGITDSFRLTPLGRQLIEKWERELTSWPTPSWLDRLYNTLARWLKLPL